MSSFEGVHESQSPAASQIEQRESVQTDSQAERVGLNIDVTQQWPDLPKTAVEYLTVKCKQPEHLPMALNFLREALKDDSSLLEDELGAESELDDFLQEAEKAASEREEQVLDSEITALDQGLAEDAAEKTVRDERVGGKKAEITRLDRLENNVDSDNVELDKKIEEGNTRNDVLTTLESNHGDKTGWAYLEAVRADVVKNNVSAPSDPDAPESSVGMARLSEAQQTEILAKLDAIAATLKQMTSLIDDPVEAQAFEALIANSSFKVGAENNYEVFSSLISNIDDSDLFSEATKTKLRVEGLGIPPFSEDDFIYPLPRVQLNEVNMDSCLLSVPPSPDA